MKYHHNLVLLICTVWLCIAGCGTSSTKTTPPSSPTSNACTGVIISGTMLDSATSQPVSQGWAVLEAGTQLATTPDYNFSITQKVASDVHGAFSLCSPTTLPNPSAIVLVALDASGNAYPASVAPISSAANLGTIRMGSCIIACDSQDGQQQTSAPATITGTITSAPIAKSGSVVARYAISVPDGSENIWALAIPSLNPVQGTTFTTAPGACPGNAPFCATYTFTLPSQKPLQQLAGGYGQQGGPPGYFIYATPDGNPSCSPPFNVTIRQQDGTSFLTVNPGQQLTASTINFTKCQ